MKNAATVLIEHCVQYPLNTFFYTFYSYIIIVHICTFFTCCFYFNCFALSTGEVLKFFCTLYNDNKGHSILFYC